MRSIKRHLRRGLVVMTAVAAVAVSLTTGTANAIDSPPCDTTFTDYMNVFFHDDNNAPFHECFANAGFQQWGWWTDEIWTGNNVVEYRDANGASVTIQKWTDYHPKNAFNVVAFTIE